MKPTKLQSKLLVACIALISVVALLKATYYEPNFFPIGLTGLNYTGGNPPYSNVQITPPWTWDNDNYDYNEKKLIFDLGVNCIGCEPACPYYMVSFGTSENNYLYKVCKPSFLDDGDSTNPEHIYVIVLTNVTDSLDF